MSRVIQWVGIIVVLLSLGGAYYYYKTRAAQPVVVDDRPSFEAPLTTSIELARGQGSPTFTRSDGADRRATVTDFEGIVRKVKAGEARFEGARRVENLLVRTEDLSTTWNPAASATVSVNTHTAPDGTLTADTLSFAASAVSQVSQTVSVTSGQVYMMSVWARTESGTRTFRFKLWNGSADQHSANLTATTTWQRLSIPITATNTSAAGNVALENGSTGTAGDVIFWGVQMENITGQANQNPSEYVSSGVLSAPYHGANVDGVKYFDTENGNTVASNVVTEGEGKSLEGFAYGSLPGTSGSYFSTPDADKLDITGDIDIRVKVAMEDWTPSEIKTLVTKFPVATSNRSYALTISTAGELRGVWSTNGSSGIVVASSTTTGFTSGTTHWVRVTRAAATGVNTFYTSEDGETWTQLGDPVSGTSGSLASTGSLLAIGGSTTGTENLVSGKIHRAQVFNGIDGTIAADFDPSEWTSGNTWTSRTGETWTRNGGAQLWKNSLKGYLAEGSRTNVIIRSEAIDNATWTDWNTTRTANDTTAPDGTTTAEKISETTDTANHHVYLGSNRPTLTNGTAYTVSVFLKAGTRGFGRLGISDHVGGGSIGQASVAVNLSDGSLGTPAATGSSPPTSVSATSTSFGNGWYRVTLTFTASASSAWFPWFGSAQSLTTVSYAGDTNMNVYAWGAQLEQASFASSYIPTTSASVTRAADNLGYQTDGNILAAQGSAYMDVYISHATAPTGRRAFDATGANNNRLQLSLVETNNVTNYMTGTGSGVQNVQTAPVVGAQKLAFNWGDSTLKARLFRNGTKIGTASAQPSINLASVMYIGRIDNSPPLELYGNVKNVKIWQKVLSDSDLEDMTAGIAGVTQITTNKRAPNDGLIGYWSFEEGQGTTAEDFSSNSNTGTLNGATGTNNLPQWTAGKAGTALDFDGTDDYVNAGSASVLKTSLPFTISFWVNPDTISTGYGILGFRETGNHNGYWIRAETSGSLHIGYGDNTICGPTGRRSKTSPASVLTAGHWNHVTAVFRGPTDMAIYVNGVDVGGTYSGTGEALTYHASSFLRLGSVGGVGECPKVFLSGVLDEVRIYNRELTAAEIADLYRTTGSSVKLSVNQNDAMTDNLVGFWSFNGPDVSGTTATDRGSSGMNLSISGATVAPGKIGQALFLDGTDDRVATAQTPLGSDPGANYTLAAWIKPSSTAGPDGGFILQHGGNSTTNNTTHATLYFNTSGGISFITRADGFGTSKSVVGTTTIEPGNWYHVAGVVSSGTMRLYVNGGSEGTPTAQATPGVHRQFTIGADRTVGGSVASGYEDFFPGIIDEVRLYSDALTADEVEELYNLGR